MPVEVFGESTSVKRGAVLEADDEERARLRQKPDMKDTLEPQAKAKAGAQEGSES